jgi:hypothetical protein
LILNVNWIHGQIFSISTKEISTDALEGEGKTGTGERGRRALTEADDVRGSARTTATGALRGRRQPGLDPLGSNWDSSARTVRGRRRPELLCFAAVGISSPSWRWGSPVLRGGSGWRMDARTEDGCAVVGESCLNRDGGEEGGLVQLTLNTLTRSARGMDALRVTRLRVAHGGRVRYG